MDYIIIDPTRLTTPGDARKKGTFNNTTKNAIKEEQPQKTKEFTYLEHTCYAGKTKEGKGEYCGIKSDGTLCAIPKKLAKKMGIPKNEQHEEIEKEYATIILKDILKTKKDPK